MLAKLRLGSEPWAGINLKGSYPPKGLWSFEWVKKLTGVPKEVFDAYYADRKYY